MGVVVDACVLRSASQADKPLPGACRAVLDAIKSNSVQVVVCAELLAEWRRHRSRYSSQWIVAMYSRKLISSMNEFSGRAEAIDHAICKLPEPQRSHASKDHHLLKIAVDNSKLVVSSEVRCREAFTVAGQHFHGIQEVSWVDPGAERAAEVASLKESPPPAWRLR